MTRNEEPVYASVGAMLLLNQSRICSRVSSRKGDTKALAGLVAPVVIALISLLVMNAISSLTVLSSIPKKICFSSSTLFSMHCRK